MCYIDGQRNKYSMIIKSRNLQIFYEDEKTKIIQKAEHIRNCADGHILGFIAL
jgi:hypothetical protein